MKRWILIQPTGHHQNKLQSQVSGDQPKVQLNNSTNKHFIVACFYLRFPSSDTQKDDFYRAVYLSERTVRNLLEKISLKKRIDPQRIVRVLHIKRDGLKIMVDDDVVRELPDGQDMDVEVSETANGDGGSKEPAVELKLSY